MPAGAGGGGAAGAAAVVPATAREDAVEVGAPVTSVAPFALAVVGWPADVALAGAGAAVEDTGVVDAGVDNGVVVASAGGEESWAGDLGPATSEPLDGASQAEAVSSRAATSSVTQDREDDDTRGTASV